MASLTCTITRAGRSDAYGRPLLQGQTYTSGFDEIKSLVQAGFASVSNPVVLDDGFFEQQGNDSRFITRVPTITVDGETGAIEGIVGLDSKDGKINDFKKTQRHVATGTFVPDAVHASMTYSYHRTPHWARDDLSSLQIVFANWNLSGGTETLGVGTQTWRASIEYPVGVIKQITFGGAVSGTNAPGQNLISDSVFVNIPRGEKFWIRIWQNSTTPIMYFQFYSSDGTAQSAYGTTLGACPDLTMGGNATTMATATQQFCITPIAIIANSAVPSIAIVGDSNSVGRGDMGSGDNSALQGILGRAFGRQYPVMHTGRSGDTMQSYATTNAKRTEMLQWATHVVMNLGINDVTAGRTPAQVLADTNAVVATFGGRPTAITTLMPVTTSTDSWATVANQTAHANDGNRIIVNAQRRNGAVVGVSTVYDIERFCESSYMSSKWQVIPGAIAPGTPSYTADGTHPNRTAVHAMVCNLNINSLV